MWRARWAVGEWEPHRCTHCGPASSLAVQQFAVNSFLERLNDFNFLLYCAVNRNRLGLTLGEIEEMCHMVGVACCVAAGAPHTRGV